MFRSIVRVTISAAASPPAGYVNAMDYCHGNGTDDDRAHILAAIAASPTGSVYFPSGRYLLSSALTVPTGSDLLGIGLQSHLLGKVSFGSTCTFTDLYIGTTGDCAITNNGNVSGTTFTRCQFRGGNGNYVTDERSAHVITLKTACSSLTFTDCNVECNLGTENAGHTSHFDNVFIQPAVVSPTIENVLFDGCTFGVTNGARLGSPRFNVEIYADNTEATRTHGFRAIDFTDCVFEAADDENLDYSGSASSANTTIPNDGWSSVTGCTFKGNGRVGVWFSDIVCEGGTGYNVVTGCTFYRGAGCAIAMQDNEGYGLNAYNEFTGNIVDYRSATYDTGITHEAWEAISIVSNRNTVANNYVYNSGPLTRRSIGIRGDYNVVTGNTLTNSGITAYHVQLESTAGNNTVTGNTFVGSTYWTGINDLGTSNTVSPNP